MTHRVVPLMYLLDDRGVVGHGTAGRSSTIQGIESPCSAAGVVDPTEPSEISLDR